MRRTLCLLAIFSLFLLAHTALALADSQAAAPTPTPFPLQAGDTSMDVKRMQSRLAVLGYYNGNVSGHFGEGTRAALMLFQADAGLPVTGVADANVLSRLDAMQYRPMRYGSSGEWVKRVQTRLTYLSYYTGKINGHYLEGTQAAIRLFQDKVGLAATGDADENTLIALFDRNAPSRGESASGFSAATAAPGDPGEVLEVPDGEAVTPRPTQAFTVKLQKGSTGEMVKKVQQRLIDLMYYTGQVDGKYQGKTITAVTNFQTMHGLAANGKVDEATWNQLFNSYGVVPPDATPRPSSAPTPVPFAITVDVANQVVTVYGRDEAGEYTVVVKQMLCSSGTTSNPSDLGDWKLNGRTSRWCFFPKWGDYAQYWTQINSSIAFHSVIYNTVNTMDLSIKSYNKIGSRASHGCVRLMVPDAKWVYENIGEGTIVSIRDHMAADPELRDALKTAPLNRSNMMPQATARPTAEPMYVSGALPPTPLREMKQNSKGEDVYWLQCKLTELGYYSGKCSGTYLKGTAEAVRRYQSAAGLRVSGTATVETLKALYEKELAVPATPTPAPTATPAPTPTPVPTPSPEPTQTPAPTE